MKSKFLKVILPAFAIMLAIGLSSFTVNDVLVEGHFYDAGEGEDIQILIDCDGTTNITCVTLDSEGNEVIVYATDQYITELKKTQL